MLVGRTTKVVTDGFASCILATAIVTALKLDVESNRHGYARAGSYYQYTTGWTLPGVPAPTTSPMVYERGAVIVDVMDRTNTAIWRGSAVTRVNQS